MWQLRHQLQRTEVPRLAHEIKRLKKRRREVWMQRLAEGERALARQDTPYFKSFRIWHLDGVVHAFRFGMHGVAFLFLRRRLWRWSQNGATFSVKVLTPVPLAACSRPFILRPQTCSSAVSKDVKPLRLAMLLQRSGRHWLSLCHAI